MFVCVLHHLTAPQQVCCVCDDVCMFCAFCSAHLQVDGAASKAAAMTSTTFATGSLPGMEWCGTALERYPVEAGDMPSRTTSASSDTHSLSSPAPTPIISSPYAVTAIPVAPPSSISNPKKAVSFCSITLAVYPCDLPPPTHTHMQTSYLSTSFGYTVTYNLSNLCTFWLSTVLDGSGQSKMVGLILHFSNPQVPVATPPTRVPDSAMSQQMKQVRTSMLGGCCSRRVHIPT